MNIIQCKPPLTPLCNDLSSSGKRPVWIKLPRIQQLGEALGFHSAGRVYIIMTHIFCAH